MDRDPEAFLVAWRRALLSALAALRETDRELLLEAAAVLGLGPVLVRTCMHRRAG
jgi:hypothetical protein